MARTVRERPEGADQPTKSGTYIAYSKYGDHPVIATIEDFTHQRDIIPFGISIAMGACTIISPSTGEVIHTWDPWGILAKV